MIFQDFLLGEDEDILIQNGDLVIGPSDNQHIEDIITSFAGDFKQFPQLGFGIMQYLKSENGKAAINEIKNQLTGDGYQLANVNVTNVDGNLVVSFPQGITRNA